MPKKIQATLALPDSTNEVQALLLAQVAKQMNELSVLCRTLNDRWWRSPKTGKPIKRNRGELLALVHSEISEALEGIRKNSMDTHLPHRPMAEVEFADAFIRLFDIAGEDGYDLGGAFVEKLLYNAVRKDHTHAARLEDNGKKF